MYPMLSFCFASDQVGDGVILMGAPNGEVTPLLLIVRGSGREMGFQTIPRQIDIAPYW